MCCRRGIVLQASSALSNPSPSAETSPVAVEQAVPLLQLEQNIQAMRAVVQAQQTQLQSLQSLQQSQPLVGLTTDQPWGMALEGLSLGLVAVVCGAGALLALHTLPLVRRARLPAPTSGHDAPPEFSDSMLYLADHENTQETPPPVATHLHDPQHDAKASTLAHEDGDAALEYHRIALTAQGLSVTAGAGRIDSDRIPLDAPLSDERGVDAIFSPSLSSVEFDQRAAAEEVERVRSYLAQRRADRTQTVVARNAAPAVATPVVPVADTAWNDVPVPTPGHVDIHLDVDVLPPGELESLAYTPLSDGASLLVALSENAGESSMADVPVLPSAHVQLALAEEFRDLGLWDEARARLQEVLEQPDAGQHAQARILLAELQQLAPPSAPLLEWPQEGDAPHL